MPEAKPFRVGVIGLGAMGAHIATRLVREGFNPIVYDVADPSVRMFTNDVGGMMSGSPKLLARCSDIVITALASEVDLREALFGWEGLVSGLRQGGVLIDLSTADPLATFELAKTLAERNIEMIDAPAPGTPDDARAGKLTLVAAGNKEAMERCQLLFAVLASRFVHAGPAGSGRAAATLGDFPRGDGLLAASEALRINERIGLDRSVVVGIGDSQGGVGPWRAATLRTQMLTWKFDSGLDLGHVLKGMTVSEGVSHSGNVHAPPLAALPGLRRKRRSGQEQIKRSCRSGSKPRSYRRPTSKPDRGK
jgi:3-hydroxyisobutyrate dehydrogenase-like beta-hydroxyacid dehydrogenase